MAVALNRSTQILIDNFIGTYFSSTTTENRAQIKKDVVEIADSILEQSNADLKDLDKLATKGDIMAVKGDIVAVKNDIMAVKGDIVAVKNDIMAINGDIVAIKSDLDKMRLEFNNKITETKFDLIKWIITAQIAIAGLLVVVISFTLSYFKVM